MTERLTEFKCLIVNDDRQPDRCDLKPGVFYVIVIAGWPPYQHLADKIVGVRFLCPCGCGVPVWESTRHRPVTIKNRHGKQTLTFGETGDTSGDSVKMRGGCGSHYFVKDNVIKWRK